MLLRFLAAFLLVAAISASAQTVATRVNRQQHDEHVARLQELVRQCEADAKACTSAQAGPDEAIELNPESASRVSYAWLRKALEEAAKKPDADRAVAAKLMLQRLSGDAERQLPPRDARSEANAVLQQVEFAETKPSWWDRMMLRFELWLARHLRFDGVSDSTVAWTRVLLEFTLFAIPLIALGVWLMRQFREDRLVPEYTRTSKDAVPPSVSWVKEAQACAERGAWREAIHALYWQTITAFEERHVWAVTRNRTPREYLALLQPGSEQRRLLREQTLLLESIWYGKRDATEADYQYAASLTRELARA